MTASASFEPDLSAQVEYGLLQAGELEAAIRLIAGAFSSADPPARAMRLAPQDLAQFLRTIVPQALEVELTTVARLRSSGEVVGAMLSDDSAAPPAVDLAVIAPGFRPIFAMLEHLEHQYFSGKSPKKGEHVHLFMLAVDARFAGRGIAQALVRRCLENAGRKGYGRAVTEATGAVSQHVFRTAGFQERVRVSYEDFTHDGEAVFASISRHGGAALMDRAL